MSESEQSLSKRITAPFTVEQVYYLNKYQSLDSVHPFTCIRQVNYEVNAKDHDLDLGGRSKLVATVNGWICPYCDYTQNWAHEFMANPASVASLELLTNPDKLKELIDRINSDEITP